MFIHIKSEFYYFTVDFSETTVSMYCFQSGASILSLRVSHTSIKSLIFFGCAFWVSNIATKNFWNYANVSGTMLSLCFTSPFAYHTPCLKVSAVFVSIRIAINIPYTGLSYFKTASET